MEELYKRISVALWTPELNAGKGQPDELISDRANERITEWLESERKKGCKIAYRILNADTPIDQRTQASRMVESAYVVIHIAYWYLDDKPKKG